MLSDDVVYLYHLEALKAELESMIWANENCKIKNEPLVFTEDDFMNMADRIRGYLN